MPKLWMGMEKNKKSMILKIHNSYYVNNFREARMHSSGLLTIHFKKSSAS